jgi:murein DD-endopeptidase MepM/ murein hydrolase activator NlpD
MIVIGLVRRLACIALVAGAVLLTGCATTRSGAPVYVVRVEKGDTLAGIAAKYDTTWEKIADLNELEDGSGVRPGDVLRVQPGPGGYAAGADAAPRQSRPRTAQAKKLKPAKRGGGGFLAPSANPAADADNAMFEEAAKTQKGRSPAARRKRGGLFTEGDDEARSGSGADGRIGADTVRWPLVGELSSHYGRRGRRLHAGVDIRARYGTPIGAASAGKVEFAGRKNGYGRIVIIRHQGIKTAYAHLSSIAVDEGDYVDAGEEIGAVGTSGNSSGPHLHFEIRRLGDQPIDPLSVLPRNRLVSSL